MKSVVIDSNVLAVANDMAPQASRDCVLTCVDRLSAIVRDGESVSLDDGFRIIQEYFKYATLAGRPGTGSAFFKWLFDNQANPEHCERVTIHARNGSDWDFEEFPDDPDLATFDKSDRKFVAVALASGHRPPILNAVDTDWWHHRKPLSRHVEIDFLCPDYFRARG